MQGTRVYALDTGNFPPLRAGDYAMTAEGDWIAVLPDGTFGRLTDHDITEHEDGTITVQPSIYLSDQWHGYLVRGEWRET